MKTTLIINDELKKYLYKEIRRTTKETEKLSKIFDRENFDYQWLFKFGDEYGVSVIKSCCGSYGFDEDLFELATVCFVGDKHDLYDLEGMDKNPIGYLTNDEVIALLYKVRDIIEGETKNEN